MATMMAKAMAPNEAMPLEAALWVVDVLGDMLSEAEEALEFELLLAPEDVLDMDEVVLVLVELLVLLLLLLLVLLASLLNSGWALAGQVRLYSGVVLVSLLDRPKLGLAPVSDRM